MLNGNGVPQATPADVRHASTARWCRLNVPGASVEKPRRLSAGAHGAPFRVAVLFRKKPPGEGEYSTIHSVGIKPLMTTSGEIAKIKLAFPKPQGSSCRAFRTPPIIEFAVDKLAGTACC